MAHLALQQRSQCNHALSSIRRCHLCCRLCTAFLARDFNTETYFSGIFIYAPSMCTLNIILLWPNFLAHLVYQPKNLIQLCFVCRRRPASALALALSSVHTSPCHSIRHRSFIFGTHIHLCFRLCTAFLVRDLNIETYFAGIFMPLVYAHQI